MSRPLPGLPDLPPPGTPGGPMPPDRPTLHPAWSAAGGPPEHGVVPVTAPGTVPGSGRRELSTGEYLSTLRTQPPSSGRSRYAVIGLVLLLVAVWWWRRPNWPGPVELAEPEQIAVQAQPVPVRDFVVYPQASFDIEGVVVGRERYRVGREAKISPYDIGIVWGIAAQPDLLRIIRYSQSSRFLWWRYRGDLPVGEDEMNRTMANIHTIPSNARVRRQLGRLRPGQVVRLTGFLVRVEAPGGWQWNSSMTRDDTGNGACEVMLVQTVERVERRVGR